MNSKELYLKIKENNLDLCTDTRDMKEGCFFAAISGENFDGNDYAQEALEKGAQFALVDNPKLSKKEGFIFVENVLQTLQGLALLHRQTFNIPIVVIGGSNGKTTTRNLLCEVLQKKYKVHQTIKNFNNHIGLPITILAMTEDTEIAVFELGANHIGEHTELIQLIQPTHVLVTNNGLDHLEGFGSVENVRTANKEIYDWAIEHNAQIFVNKDLVDLFEDSSLGNQIVYSGQEFKIVPGEYLKMEFKNYTIQSQLYGSYNSSNIAAAMCVGEEFGVGMKDMVQAIGDFQPKNNRSQVIKKVGYTIILDCYNANPSSMEVSLQDLFKIKSRKIIILGDMLELGEYARGAHKDILDLVEGNVSGNDNVICVGEYFFEWKDSFDFVFVKNSEEAKEIFDSLEKENSIIFLKGSRGIALETIVE